MNSGRVIIHVFDVGGEFRWDTFGFFVVGNGGRKQKTDHESNAGYHAVMKRALLDHFPAKSVEQIFYDYYK